MTSFCGRDEGPKKWKRIKSIKGGERQSLDPNSASNVTQNRAGGENTKAETLISEHDRTMCCHGEATILEMTINIFGQKNEFPFLKKHDNKVVDGHHFVLSPILVFIKFFSTSVNFSVVSLLLPFRGENRKISKTRI